MKKSEKIIWTTALILGAVSLYVNIQEIPEEIQPPFKKGEFYCPAHIQEQANKLKPNINIKQTVKDYENKIKNASTSAEAWFLKEKINTVIQNYNEQIKEYNLFLQSNCIQ